MPTDEQLARLVKPPPRKKTRRRNDSGWFAECARLRGLACRVCATTVDVQMDHIWPRSQGGPSAVENGMPLCRRHHDRKTMAKLRIRREWLDADQVAWLALNGWVVWDDSGQPRGRGWRHFEPVEVR